MYCTTGVMREINVKLIWVFNKDMYLYSYILFGLFTIYCGAIAKKTKKETKHIDYCEVI